MKVDQNNDFALDIIAGKSQEVGVDINHSHIFLIDDGREKKFGGEIKFRAGFESAIGKLYHCPIVLLVIQVRFTMRV